MMDVKMVHIIWCIMLVLICLYILMGTVRFADAQWYFPVTSGLGDFYHYGTLRYGTLYGLSWVSPFGFGGWPYSLFGSPFVWPYWGF